MALGQLGRHSDRLVERHPHVGVVAWRDSGRRAKGSEAHRRNRPCKGSETHTRKGREDTRKGSENTQGKAVKTHKEQAVKSGFKKPGTRGVLV